MKDKLELVRQALLFYYKNHPKVDAQANENLWDVLGYLDSLLGTNSIQDL